MKGYSAFFAVTLVVSIGIAMGAHASATVPQMPLPGEDIPKFVTPLPTFGPGSIPRVTENRLTVRMLQTQQQVLPSGYGETVVWAYQLEAPNGKVVGPAHWPAVSIEARRGLPTTIRYVNELPAGNAMSPVANPYDPAFSLQALVTVDQTLHWADPLKRDCAETPFRPDCQVPYLGQAPAVVHLHGGEVPAAYDGGPQAWFTPGLEYTGPAFVTDTYVYPNTQEPGTLWFHDHALGITRTNVYSGLAGFYLLRDPGNEPLLLPSREREIELAIQDRQFDLNGQLLFPDEGINPIHPFWTPETFGDAIVVNGVTWPYLEVEARRYRFRVLNGSNARFYRLSFGSAAVWQIGADDNYLDAPVPRTQVVLGPGERADLIIDFASVAGSSFVITNDAPAPFPNGDPADPLTVGQIMQVRVGPALRQPDRTCDPTGVGPPGVGTAGLDCRRRTPMVRLARDGEIVEGVQVDRVRRLTLNEVLGMGGPLEVLLNNTEFGAPTTESPRVGSTELWEVINLTADSHPIHTHLVQYQLLNRQTFDVEGYTEVYEASFPGGEYLPGGGPPLEYEQGTTTISNGQTVPLSGGNPDVTAYLDPTAVPPDAGEAGWKDTARFPPGAVTRFLVRWAPTDAPVTGVACSTGTEPLGPRERRCRPVPGSNLFSFDPTSGPGYAWHCHILEHEDNEMMRPYEVVP